MISINDYLSCDMWWVKVLDERTLNSLNNNANIYYVNDLINFCSVSNFENKLLSIKWLWKNWLIKIINLLDLLKSEWIELLDDEEIDIQKNQIDPNIYSSNLNLYSSYFSLRTINSLKSVKIYTVSELFENKKIYLKWVRWLWKNWLIEINSFINYINDTFSTTTKNINLEKNISDYIVDERLNKILLFNWINKISELEPYINNKDLFNHLRYLNTEDYSIIKEIFEKNLWFKKEELNFSIKFINILDNLSSIEKQILEYRILWNLTLTEVWDKVSLTRERVRQKQKYIESIISESSNLFLNQNPDILQKILNIIKIHKYIFLPHDLEIFKFLWFLPEQSNLLFLFLKWISWIKWETIDNKIYCILSSDIMLSWEDLNNIYIYITSRIKNNNDDLNIDELFYELIYDNAINKKVIYNSKRSSVTVSEEKKTVPEEKKKELNFLNNWRNNVYELIFDD